MEIKNKQYFMLLNKVHFLNEISLFYLFIIW